MKKRKRFLFLVIFILFLSVISFIYLYNTYSIFVKYIEHGVLIGKEDLGNNFKYRIYIDGKEHFFTTKDKLIDLNRGVISFKYRKGKLVKFLGYAEPIQEKVMSRSGSSIELEYSGNLKLSKNTSVYTMSDGSISVKSLNSIIVGAKNIKVYKDKKSNIRTIILDGNTELTFMRVGIKTEGFQSFDHNKMEFISDEVINLEDKKDKKLIQIPPKTRAAIIPSKDGVSVQWDNNSYSTKNRVYISSLNNKALIKILSFKRGYGNPSYRGFFEITGAEGKLNIINEVSIENYLYQVVPSEMPSSFGLEALKAQAVAARTYAVSDLLSGRYASSVFLLDDRTMSLVYNNSSENNLATLAVNGTKGLVMKYENELIDAKYYSTSHGYGANAHEIWSDGSGKFPSDVKPYLTVRNYLLNKEEFNLSSEEDASMFFKDWNIKSYDSNSPYYRWKLTLSGEELKNTIEKNLPTRYSQEKGYILTQVKGQFQSKDIPQNPIGELTDLKVLRRGEGGNIMELLICGTKGTYKVVKELNVRYVIRPRKSDTGSSNDVIIKRIKGGDLKNATLLPSAFMVFDIEKESDGKIKSVTFYGGGYGHSTGMSQYGAGYLASKGYTFDKILKTYYKDIAIEKLY